MYSLVLFYRFDEVELMIVKVEKQWFEIKMRERKDKGKNGQFIIQKDEQKKNLCEKVVNGRLKSGCISTTEP